MARNSPSTRRQASKSLQPPMANKPVHAAEEGLASRKGQHIAKGSLGLKGGSGGKGEGQGAVRGVEKWTPGSRRGCVHTTEALFLVSSPKQAPH